MRKILGISASTRRWGNCETAVKQVLEAAAENGARPVFRKLGDLEIRPCRGCLWCIREEGRCPLEDGLYPFLDEVGAADDLVLGSPVYFMSPPAALVGLMDRLLTVNAYMVRSEAVRRAVTLTVMGNREWRGVAEPFVNLTASLLGFEIAASLSLVAEGPGEVLEMADVVEDLAQSGRALAGGGLRGRPEESGSCPVCRSDFFRIEPPLIVCPVCGLEGELEAYTTNGVFRPTGKQPRWGREWLAAHIDAWIRPSLVRYAGNRRKILAKLRSLKDKYREIEERGT